MFESVKRGAAAGRDLRTVYKRHVRRAQAPVRPLGDLRPLPAFRRDARLRRSDAVQGPAHLDRAARQGNVAGARRLKLLEAFEVTRLKTYTNPVYDYRRAPELDGTMRHCGVVVVGAGPVGLAAAIDFAQRGIPVLVLDDDDTVSVGSRAICYAKRTLEILDRLGCGEPVRDEGRELERRQGLPRRSTRLPVRPAARTGPSPAGVRQPAAVLLRGIPGAARRCAGRRRNPLEAPRGRRGSSRRRRASRCASPRRTATMR